MNPNVVNGLFLIGGALLGSVGAISATWLQVRSEREIEREQRLFDARKQIYIDSLKVFTDFVTLKQSTGRAYAGGKEAESGDQINRVMASLNLLSSTQIITAAASLTLSLKVVSAISNEEQVRLLSNLTVLMKREIGIGK